jgi:hypothetical protein
MSNNIIKSIMSEADNLTVYKNERDFSKQKILKFVKKDISEKTGFKINILNRFSGIALTVFGALLIFLLTINTLMLYSKNEEIKYIDSVISEIELHNTQVDDDNFDFSELEY